MASALSVTVGVCVILGLGVATGNTEMLGVGSGGTVGIGEAVGLGDGVGRAKVWVGVGAGTPRGVAVDVAVGVRSGGSVGDGMVGGSGTPKGVGVGVGVGAGPPQATSTARNSSMGKPKLLISELGQMPSHQIRKGYASLLSLFLRKLSYRDSGLALPPPGQTLAQGVGQGLRKDRLNPFRSSRVLAG